VNEKFRTIETDVLVVGAGAAGGRAAIEAGRNNVNVILVEKGFMGKSGTTAQAGSRAVRPHTDKDAEGRFKYQLGSGCYLNDQDVLWTTCKEAPEDCEEIIKFAKEMNAGPMDSWNNALRHEIVKYPNISVLENMIVTKLLTSDGKIVGATGLDIRRGEFIVFKVKAVILTTGGYGDLYNPSECTPLDINGGVWGDGNSLAYHAGVEQVEMEMVNYQPLPDNPKWNRWYRHLKGFDHHGPFIDAEGKPILSLTKDIINAMPIGYGPPRPGRYTPELELKIFRESLKRPIYVDAPKIAEELIREGKPLTIPEKTLQVDHAKLPKMKIVLGPLIGSGGPRINERSETNIVGLYAAGECAGNIYGAHRGNPFIDSTQPQGRRAGKYAAEYAKNVTGSQIDLEEVKKERKRVINFREPKPNSISPREFKKKIWEITGKYLFIIRNAKGLTEAIKELDEMRKQDLPRIQAVDITCMNLDWVDAIEAAFALDVAEMIARSALFRKESRGAHYRDDFPEVDNKNWLCHTSLKKEGDKMKLYKTPVVMTMYKPPLKIGEEPVPI